jgi:CoA transferase family III
MSLTGRAGGPPLVAPEGVVAEIVAIGERAGVDGLRRLGERAAVARYSRRGATSCGGSTRLVRAQDDWVAVALPRPDDVALLPAWLGVPADAHWDRVTSAVARSNACELVARGAELGLAVARRREVVDATPVHVSAFDAVARLTRAPVVVDLSSLWAGPLATQLLRRAGARVIKVESRARPDGARRGPARFFDALHAGTESVVLDFGTTAGVAQLRGLLQSADVVVEASRPRALEQLGIDARQVVAHGPRVWLSITGHGRDAAQANRIAFGDDAAVAGGLVADDERGACFVADAVADPLTGMVAATAVLEALPRPSRVLLDVALARVAASVARAGGEARWRCGDGDDARPPAPPDETEPAPQFGAHTDAVLREFGA